MFNPDDCFGCLDDGDCCSAYPTELNIIPCPCGTCLIKTMCESSCNLYDDYLDFIEERCGKEEK